MILLLGAEDRVAGGATVELYRTADCGLLTYLWSQRSGAAKGSAADSSAKPARPWPAWQAANKSCSRRRSGSKTPSIRKSARRQFCAGPNWRARWTAGRFRLLDAAAAPGPAHAPARFDRFETGIAAIPAEMVARLMRELAAALGADLDGDPQTSRMMAWLSDQHVLALRPLLAADSRSVQ